MFVPGLFLSKLNAVLDHVLPLAVVVGEFPRTVLVVMLFWAFPE